MIRQAFISEKRCAPAGVGSGEAMGRRGTGLAAWPLVLLLAGIGLASSGRARAAEAARAGEPARGGNRAPVSARAVERYRAEVQPILKEYCFDCHGDGADKGKVAFDAFGSERELVGQQHLWLAVLKNVRAGLMPPEKKAKPSARERELLEEWIKREALGLDPDDPDPGRVTVRRLNRTEYQNTIRDLMGHDFKVEDELPPDDTGYGFDNNGDVLAISPLLLEKYMQAAETIVARAVPRVPRVVPERVLPATSFSRVESAPPGKAGDRPRPGDKGKERERPGDRFSFYDTNFLQRGLEITKSGRHRVTLELEVYGEFDFDPGRCRVVLKAGDEILAQKELSWQNGQKFAEAAERVWPAGRQQLTLEIHPLTPVEKKKNSLTLRVAGVRVEGPLEPEHWVRPPNFDRFFTQDPPEARAARRAYAREVLSRFVRRAYRRPVDARTVDKLVAIAEAAWKQPGRRFEDGIAEAMVPVLASPRFLFRVEEIESPAVAAKRAKGVAGPDSAARASRHPLVDEHSLASRLSYFLWSTMPDAELSGLADRGELRANLGTQVKRMLADERAGEFVENFVGQWLQVRDVEGIDINARVVLSRDAARDRELDRNRQRFRQLRDIPDEQLTPEQKKEIEELRGQFRRRFGERPEVELDGELRRALRRESEMLFAHLVREDRSVLELLDSNYTFLNERLAKHYGITNVTGRDMRRVELPPDSPRGGVLTHGAVLIVTSNPTRTSPVKRGLFILENILGTPPPPAPPNVPPLESSEKEEQGRTPTLRETLAIHRENALCRSCHNRMDPLGLALENFNALGMWRDRERGQPIDATGTLITGEPFRDIRDIKKVLVSERRGDFYHCLAEKLLTYALGRGPTPADVETLDRIVADLERSGGRMSSLILGVIESAPFQRQRVPAAGSAGKGARAEVRTANRTGAE